MIIVCRVFLLALFLLLCGKSHSQEPNYDTVLSDDIGAITFNLKGLFLSNPVIYLNRGSTLELRFDDLTAGDHDYIYMIEHCNADWTRSQLSELDYIKGFNGDPINNFQSSFTTLIPYTQYYLEIPNRNLQFKVSGNYLLKVYEDTDERKLALVRRFMVVDNKMKINHRFRARATNGKWKSDQEFEFEVVHKNIKVTNPLINIKASVLQNNRWDNAKVAVTPNLVRSESVLFSKQGQFIFPGGKEFRRLDLRSLLYGSGKIGEIVRLEDFHEVYLWPEKKRAYGSYFSRVDINGKYVIENLDNRPGAGAIAFDLSGREEYDPSADAFQDLAIQLPQGLDLIQQQDTSSSFNPFVSNNRVTQSRIQENNQTRGDYADVFFYLKSPTEFEDQEVYIIGGFSDWQLLDGYKMSYNEKYKAYEGKAFLKQGYYEYYYVTVPKGTKTIVLDDTEGSHSETENDYTILVYYRPIGSRYDQLVAAKRINTHRNQ